MVNNKNRILFFLLTCLMPMALFSQSNHWTPVSAPYEDNMTLTGVIQINGTEQQSTALEVGAFCGTECRGSARAMLFPATGRYLVMLTIYGNNGDQITFKLYNHNLGAVLDYQSPSAITFGSNGLGTVTAPYVLNYTGGNHTVTVSASPTAGGTVSGGGTYTHGSTCTLTATPNTGYNFVRWMKNGSQVSTSASYSFTVTEDASYVAVFTLKSYIIRPSANPSAGGTVSGGGTYTHGSTCTLTATANSGYTFTNWTKNGSVVSTNASYSFTVTASGNYVANFVEGFNITATASPTAGGTVSGGGIYTNGTTCTLTATPNTGYNFVRWTKNGSQVSTSTSYSFTVTEDASYVAVFTLKSYIIRPSANPTAGGTVSGGGTYTHGSTCTLTATANTGYTFTNWTKNGTIVSTDASYSFTVTASGNYVANFSLTATNYLTTLSDDFNDGIIDSELWLSTGDNVYEEEGLLKMDQNITDQNVCLLSKPMSVGADNKITIDRRFMVHKAYNYYYGGFAIEFNSDTDIHGRPLHADSWDGSIANTFGVDYIGIVYGYTNYENKFGIYVEDGVGSEIRGIRLCDVVFDTWLNEQVLIDLSTGTLDYYLDDTLIATVDITGLTTLGVNYYTTIFGPWGWWTGHQHYMDYVHINAANAQTTVTIGEGTATCNTNPIGTYYNYSITEQLYTAGEIGMAGTISSVSFYYMGIAAKDLPITMYMKHVDEEDLSSAGISIADADEVFSGTLSVTTTAGWVTIDLDNPFYYDGSSSLLIGFIKDYLYYFSGQSWQGTATTSTMARYTQNDNSAYTTSTVPGTAQANRPNIQMVIIPSGGDICDKPETMEASNVTTNSATLTWTSGSGNYNVEYKLASAEDWIRLLNNTTVTTYTLTGLDPGKVYKARAQSVCATNVSGWKNVSFNTQFSIPLVEEFGTNLPMGWAQYTGKMDTIITGGTLGPVTNGWYFGTGNGVFDNHARVNIYSTNCLKWLVMPTVIMEDNVQLMFDVAYTAYSGSGAAPAQTGTDDKFVVLINNGGNWEILRQWDNAGSCYVLNDLNVTPATVVLDLSTFAGNEVAIAFYAESTVSNADNNLHIDNVSIDYIPECARPMNLAVSQVSAHNATVTWTSDASTWQICLNDDETNLIETTENPIVLTGLTPETDYTVKVRAYCSDELQSEWSRPLEFTTTIACPAPTALSAEPTPDGAVVTWTGDDEADYEIGWASTASDAILLQYDDNTYATSLGNSSAANWTWAVMYPSSMLNGNRTLSMVQVYEIAGYYQNDYTVSIYNGDDSAPTTELGEISVTPTGVEGFHSFMIPEEIDIDPEQNLWIVLNVTGTYVMSSCETTEPNNQWVYYDGTWANLGELASDLADYGWMVRGLVSSLDPFNSVTGVTSPYTIEGLDSETTFFARVRSLCGDEDGESKWVCCSFTTLENCPIPFDFTFEDLSYNHATISWSGFNDSYNVQMGVLGAATAVYDADFADGTIPSDFINDETYPWTVEEGNEGKCIKSSNAGVGSSTSAISISKTVTGAIGIIEFDAECKGEGSSTFWDHCDFYIDDDLMFKAGANISGWNHYSFDFDGGTHTFTWSYTKDSSVDPTGDYFAVTNIVIKTANMVWEDIVSVEETEYTFENLEPETTYYFRVQGVCGGSTTEWTPICNFTTPTISQTLELFEGWNWVSLYVEGEDAVATLQLLENALGDNATQITSADFFTEYDEEWYGELDEIGITNDQTYMILAAQDCTVVLEGDLSDPASIEITINPGWNWIGFPCDHEMTISEALGGFDAEEGDVFANSELFTEFEDGEWFGDVAILIPGQGFMYYSNSTEPKMLIIGGRKK